MSTQILLYLTAPMLFIALCWIFFMRKAYNNEIIRCRSKMNFMTDAMEERMQRLMEMSTLVDNYKRVQAADNAMIERVLKELEQCKEGRVELLQQLGVYAKKAGIVHSSFSEMENWRSGEKDNLFSVPALAYRKHFIAVGELYLLQTLNDAGIKPKPAASGDRPTESGAAS